MRAMWPEITSICSEAFVNTAQLEVAWHESEGGQSLDGRQLSDLHEAAARQRLQGTWNVVTEDKL